jgi:hypothetical protein
VQPRVRWARAAWADWARTDFESMGCGEGHRRAIRSCRGSFLDARPGAGPAWCQARCRGIRVPFIVADGVTQSWYRSVNAVPFTMSVNAVPNAVPVTLRLPVVAGGSPQGASHEDLVTKIRIPVVPVSVTPS